jgi:peptide/nickel transport system substrate-binding protein
MAGWITKFRASASWIALLVVLFIVACGTAATPTQSPEGTEVPAVTPSTQATPTAIPTQVSTEGNAISAKSTMTIVTGAEPPTIDAFLETTTTFGQVVTNFVETLTIPDTLSGKPVAGSGFSRWELQGPERWRWFLRPGIKFSNGEPWDAGAAKYSIDYSGDQNNNTSTYGQTGDMSAEIVDDLTVDIVCQTSCPILDMAAMWLAFQAPEWHAGATEDQRARNAIGYGPYQLVEWVPGQFIKATAYEDYVAAPERHDYQPATIKDVTWVWRGEEAVRAAMLITAEADVGYGLPLDEVERLPKHFLGTEGGTYGFRMDTIWEPALKNVKLRKAMVHAIDCEAIAQSLFQGIPTCRGSVVGPGVLGVNPEKTPPYQYDPELARQLIKESGYAGQELKVYAREERRPKGIEVSEAVVGYWQEVGINANLVILESAKWNDFHRTGPGKYGDDALNAANMVPPPPTHSSPQILAGSTMGSPDTRELGRNFSFYLNCFSDRAKVCDPNRIQPMVEAALAAAGEERRQRLEEIAQLVYDEVLVIPLFDTITVWGMAEDLEWQPRVIDESIRVNTMRWAQ